MKIGDQTYKNHLDGYNQMDLLTGKGPSARHELFYFGESQLGALRIDDFKFQFFQQPFGWPGEKVTTDMPTIINLRQDPFERTPSIRGETLNDLGGGYMNDFMAREFWRFVQVQQTVGAAAQSADRLPTDAGGRFLQPRDHQGEDRGNDEGVTKGNKQAARSGRAELAPPIYNITTRWRGRRVCRVIHDAALLTFRHSFSPGIIEGECVGVSGDAENGVTVAAKIFLGGRTQTFARQPFPASFDPCDCSIAD